MGAQVINQKDNAPLAIRRLWWVLILILLVRPPATPTNVLCPLLASCSTNFRDKSIEIPEIWFQILR